MKKKVDTIRIKLLLTVLYLLLKGTRYPRHFRPSNMELLLYDLTSKYGCVTIVITSHGSPLIVKSTQEV